MSAARRLAVLVGALLLFRLGSALVVVQPGYTDAYYYADVAKRLAAGHGLTADFIWNGLEGTVIPIASHRFWMPLATVLQAIGIKGLPFLDPFGAAQAAEILVACAIPVVAYLAARSLGASPNGALVAAALAGLGGAFAPGWVSLDAFGPAAVIGTAFFLCYGRAASGDVRYGALAGLAVGLLFLARAEGALFGLALLALLASPRGRRAGLAGSAVALLIGAAWLVRDLGLGPQPDLLARSVLLVRYEQFFSTTPPTGDAFLAALPDVLAAKVAALGTNAVTLVFGFGLLLVPGIAIAIRGSWDRSAVRAFAGLLVVIYLIEGLGVTLHSTRGSYFHSLAAFLPFGVALGVVGSARLLRTADLQRVAAAAGLTAAVALSAFAVIQWGASFDPPYRERVAALSSIPAGPFYAIDAAAWRWIADRPVVVTPANGLRCAFPRIGPNTLVLERVHFSIYEPIYAGTAVPAYVQPRAEIGGTKIYDLDSPSLDRSCSAP